MTSSGHGSELPAIAVTSETNSTSAGGTSALADDDQSKTLNGRRMAGDALGAPPNVLHIIPQLRVDPAQSDLFGLHPQVRGIGSLGASRISPSAAKPPPLPRFMKGAKTTGVLRTSRGDVSLSSGRLGPAQAIPAGSRGFDAYTRTHVEGHAAGLMKSEGITEGTLFINNPNVCASCSANLSRMLAPGSTLTVITPNGVAQTYRGTSQ
jgi:hypothetical protein